jgi:hypothetical protein
VRLAGFFLAAPGSFSIEGPLLAVSAISRRLDYRLLYNRYTIESGIRPCGTVYNGSQPQAVIEIQQTIFFRLAVAQAANWRVTILIARKKT